MGDVKEYKASREENAKLAKYHTEEMEKKYRDEILSSVKSTIMYDSNHIFEPVDSDKKGMTYLLESKTTVEAAYEYGRKEKTALLNFASYKNPGGMFMKGSMAQEESLCHASNLYNVLVQFSDEYYNKNKTVLNRALYINKALYTPNIIFHHKNIDFPCDVITCAAPNKNAAQKYQNVSDEENYDVLKSRIKFVLDIAREQNVKVLILGAFGCGVFGQDPREVATIFIDYLMTEYKDFDTVIFAIPNTRKVINYEEFANVYVEKFFNL